MQSLFWLHIKKSAGISTRRALEPYYKIVDRTQRPKNFIQAEYSEYNDILNNYRVPLGNYQLKRALFAKEYLYKEKWENLFSFAFSREPIDRCLSMFYFLFWKKTFKNRIYSSFKSRRIFFSDSYAFDHFLELISISLNSYSNYEPLGLAFKTHVNPMWNDISDNKGEILLSKIFRLEDFIEGVNYALKIVNAENINCKLIKKNVNSFRGSFYPNNSQIKKIENLYKNDFDLYENINFSKR